MGGWASASIITKSPSHPNHLPWNPPKSSSITSTAFFLESLRSSLNRPRPARSLNIFSRAWYCEGRTPFQISKVRGTTPCKIRCIMSVGKDSGQYKVGTSNNGDLPEISTS
ncbi:hypothetical protein V1520DRAFT_46453 [Lipomyces starkeyi]